MLENFDPATFAETHLVPWSISLLHDRVEAG